MRFLKTNLRRNFYKLAKKCNYISSELNYRYLNTLNYLSYESVYLTNYEDEIEKAQYSLLRQNPTANCVGFYGANCKSKEEHFKKFTLELTTRNYSLFNFKGAEDLFSLKNYIKETKAIFNSSNRRGAVVIENIDEILNKLNSKDKKILIELLLDVLNSKNEGLSLIWKALYKDKINRTILNKSDYCILVKPTKEDEEEIWLDYIKIVSKIEKTQERIYLLSDAKKSFLKLFYA